MVFFGLILGQFTHSWPPKNCWLSATSNVVQFIKKHWGSCKREQSLGCGWYSSLLAFVTCECQSQCNNDAWYMLWQPPQRWAIQTKLLGSSLGCDLWVPFHAKMTSFVSISTSSYWRTNKLTSQHFLILCYGNEAPMSTKEAVKMLCNSLKYDPTTDEASMSMNSLRRLSSVLNPPWLAVHLLIHPNRHK